jgi:hypothetical protein
MKHSSTVTAILTILCAVAQSPAAQETPPEPQFGDVFSRLDAGKLVSLEKETAAIEGKSGGFMVATAKAFWEIPGARSTVRFAANKPLEFVVRSPLANTAVDPSSVLYLRRMDSKKKTREIVYMTGHFSPIGGSSKTNLSEGILPLTFARYGTGSIKIVTAPLPPGEYALSVSYGQVLYCFGLD